MKRFVEEYIPAWLLLLVFGLIVLHAPITVYIGSHWPQLALAVKAWKELCLVMVLILIVATITRRHIWRQVWADRLIRLSAGYAAVCLVMAVVMPVSAMAAVAGLMIDLRFVLFFILVLVFLRIYPQYRRSFVMVGIVGATVVIGFILLELVLPRDSLAYLGYSKDTIAPYLTVDSNPDFVRYNSTLRGPNPLGAYAAIVLAGTVSFGMMIGKRRESARIRLLHLGLAAGSIVALWVSYSRSAWVAALIAVMLLTGQYYTVHRRKLPWRLLVVASLVIVCLGIFFKDTSLVRNVVWHDNPSTGALLDSNTGHINSLNHGFTRALQQPFGAGVGSTGSASLFGDTPIIIENYYLTVAHETGWLGLGLFVLLYTMIIARLTPLRHDWMARATFASGIGLACAALVLPVWADDTTSIIWWGLAAVMLAKGGEYGTTTDKKTT